MPVNGIVIPRPRPVSVPAGTHRSPWLVPEHPPVRRARTYLVVNGPELLRWADAENQSSPILEPTISTAYPSP